MMKAQADLWRLSMRTGVMLVEANMVIAMRIWGMAGAWNLDRAETQRMVEEKGTALMAAGKVAASAMAVGKPPVDVALAALAPVARKTRANAVRLGKRGVKMPS